MSQAPEDGVFVDGVRARADSDGEFVIRSGSELSINAGFDGISNEDVQWAFDDGDALLGREDRATISVTPDGSRLTVSSVNETDAGTFSAFASNDINSVSAGVVIRVIGMSSTAFSYCLEIFSPGSGSAMINRRADIPVTRTPDSVTASVVEPLIYVARGQTLSIPFSAVGTVSWMKDGEPLAQDERIQVASDGSLQIQEVREEDEGTYAVTATQNMATDTQEVQIRLGGEMIV